MYKIDHLQQKITMEWNKLVAMLINAWYYSRSYNKSNNNLVPK